MDGRCAGLIPNGMASRALSSPLLATSLTTGSGNPRGWRVAPLASQGLGACPSDDRVGFRFAGHAVASSAEIGDVVDPGGWAYGADSRRVRTAMSGGRGTPVQVCVALL